MSSIPRDMKAAWLPVLLVELGAACVALRGGALMDWSSTSCHLSRYQEVLWSVPVEMGGRARTFLLDFGAGVTLVDASVAAELGLHEIGGIEGWRMTGERIEVALVRPIPLTVAGRTLSPSRLGRMELRKLLPPDWPPIDGVLALDIFENEPLRVDLADDRLVLGGVGDLSGLAPLTVRLHRQVADVSLCVLVAVAAGDGELWFELDNSSTGPVLLSHAAAARLGVAPSDQDATIEASGLPPFHTPIAVRDLIYDGILGRSFVDGRTFVFDLSAGRVWVGRTARPPH